MSFSIKPLPIHAIIISTPHRDFDPKLEMASYIQVLRAELDRVSRPATFITLMDELAASYGDVTTYLAGLTRGEMAVASHPNIKSIIVVTSDERIALQAGETERPLLTVTQTLAEAVAYAG